MMPESDWALHLRCLTVCDARTYSCTHIDRHTHTLAKTRCVEPAEVLSSCGTRTLVLHVGKSFFGACRGFTSGATGSQGAHLVVEDEAGEVGCDDGPVATAPAIVDDPSKQVGMEMQSWVSNLRSDQAATPLSILPPAMYFSIAGGLFW